MVVDKRTKARSRRRIGFRRSRNGMAERGGLAEEEEATEEITSAARRMANGT